MKILLVNKFYYNRGGDCTAVMATEKLLKDNGHDVAIFSMQYPMNITSPWDKYFPSEISFSDPHLSGKIKAAVRLFHSSETAKKFKQLLKDFKPDVVHLHNIHSYLSPIVAQIAHKKGIKVVWTLHDYKLICPSYSCRRNGKPCELCFCDKSNVFTKRCMKNSRIASLLAWMEAIYWNRGKIEKITDRFISPSAFLKGKMVTGGFKAEQIEVLHNFMYKQAGSPPEHKDNYYCYVGRLSEEKGVDTLLEAAQQLPYPLKIIGDGPLLDIFKKQYTQFKHIEFTGRLSSDQLLPLVQQARLLVIPSVCYDNNPFSLIEALCMGTPVLGANIGGIPELITEGVNGFLFTPGESVEMKSKIEQMFGMEFDYKDIAQQAQKKFSAENFFNRLNTIYDKN
ncbi:MAG: glycosyltransferase [Tannerella sp.]|jgi:glycosyltransferase involved in cell wall biosynthesis|nr:glycosyltransferase [Tannerella sp.]